MPSPRTAILIHGCHLQAEEWERIVWGAPPLKGRIMRGVEEAVRRDAELILWGSGASEQDGVLEADYTFSLALERINELATACDKDSETLGAYLREVSVLDTVSQNTQEEITAFLALCHVRGIEEAYLVSSPTHIARCLQYALVELEKSPASLRVYACASDTSYVHSSPEDVAIIEPPHRGDRPNVPLNKTVKRINQFRRSAELAAGFDEALVGLVDEWEKKL